MRRDRWKYSCSSTNSATTQKINPQVYTLPSCSSSLPVSGPQLAQQPRAFSLSWLGGHGAHWNTRTAEHTEYTTSRQILQWIHTESIESTEVSVLKSYTSTAQSGCSTQPNALPVKLKARSCCASWWWFLQYMDQATLQRVMAGVCGSSSSSWSADSSSSASWSADSSSSSSWSADSSSSSSSCLAKVSTTQQQTIDLICYCCIVVAKILMML